MCFVFCHIRQNNSGKHSRSNLIGTPELYMNQKKYLPPLTGCLKRISSN